MTNETTTLNGLEKAVQNSEANKHLYEFVVNNPAGMHARPATKIQEIAYNYMDLAKGNELILKFRRYERGKLGKLETMESPTAVNILVEALKQRSHLYFEFKGSKPSEELISNLGEFLSKNYVI